MKNLFSRILTNKRSTVWVTGLVTCIVLAGFWQADMFRVDSQRAQNSAPTEMTPAIDDFWRASTAGDKKQISDTTESVPNDFYKMWNQCEAAAGVPRSRRKGSTDNVLPAERSVGGDERNIGRKEILAMAETIKREHYDSYRIAETKRADNHALIDVIFGKNGRQNFDRRVFLLDNSSGRWKIFMITGRGLLVERNPYFGQASCRESGDEPSVSPGREENFTEFSMQNTDIRLVDRDGWCFLLYKPREDYGDNREKSLDLGMASPCNVIRTSNKYQPKYFMYGEGVERRAAMLIVGGPPSEEFPVKGLFMPSGCGTFLTKIYIYNGWVRIAWTSDNGPPLCPTSGTDEVMFSS